jgi:hypothetical protein
MAIQHTVNIGYTSPSGTTLSQLAGSGDVNLELNLTIAALASSAETDMTIDYTKLQAFFILASAAMTVVFKSGTGGTGTTAATLTLVAGVPQFWVYGNGTNPFSAAVVGQALVTSTAGGTLTIRALSQV